MSYVAEIHPQGGKNIRIAHNQYHGCWWPGSMQSQGISSNGIDLVLPEYIQF